MRRLIWAIVGLTGLLLCIPGRAQTVSVALNESSGNYTSVGTGVNIGTHDYFSSYIRKNLIPNPGMQPVITNVNVSVASTGTTTTFTDANAGSGITANQFAGGTFHYACTGGQFSGSVQTCAGPNLGATGTIVSNTAANGTTGATFTISSPLGAAPTANDTIFVFAPKVAMANSGINFNAFQWSPETSGTGSVTVDSSSADIPTGTVQCIELSVGATADSTATLTTNFDTTGGMLNYAFSGVYTQGVSAKILSGSGMTLTMATQRSGGVNGSNAVTLSGTGYQTYTGTFTGTETGATTQSNVGISYTLTGPAGSAICLNDATLISANDTNPSLARNQVQTDLAAMNAGEVRFSWPVNGDSLVNMLAPESSRSASQGEGQTFNTPSIGVHDFLAEMNDFGKKQVWLSLPCTLTTTDATNFVDYLAAAAGGSNTWANLRASLGETLPWTSLFNRIVIEYCNEAWNQASGNLAMPQYSVGSNAGWNYVPLVVLFDTALKADSNWNSAVMKTAANVQTANAGFFGGLIAAADTGHNVDLLAANEYGMFDVANCSVQDEFQSATTEAFANAMASDSASGFFQSTTSGRPVGIYEYNNSTDSGGCTQAQINGLPEGEGYALTDTLMPLLANKQFGITDQDYFVLYQNSTGISTTGGATSIQEWGIKTGPGGAFNNMRPSGYGLGIANACSSLGTGYAATPTSLPTLAYTGGNGVSNITVPLMQFFPFMSGNQRCIVVENTDFTNSHTFAFTGTNIPTGTVTVTTLTAAATTTTNEAADTAPAVTPAVTTVSSPTSFTLAPHSLESIAFTVSSPLPTPPSNAFEFANLQNSGNGFGTWTQCNTPACSGSDTGVGTSAVAFGVTSPVLESGSAMQITSTSTSGEFFNTLTFLHLGCTTLPGGCIQSVPINFLVDLFFEIPSSNVGLQALEFDPDLFDGVSQYLASQQCDSASGDWRFWNEAAGEWVSSGIACGVLSETNTVHHYQLFGQFNQASKTYTYQTFVLDGATVYANLGQSFSAAPLTGTATFNVQNQIDGNTAVGTNVELLDNYNMWVWPASSISVAPNSMSGNFTITGNVTIQ
jgi:hypothetical protein